MPASGVITVRPFDPDRDAEAIAEAIVDSSRHHTALEPERYHVLDREAVAEVYRRGRQQPGGIAADEQATLVAELDGRVVGIVDVRIAHPGGAHRPLRYAYIPEVAVAEPARSRGVGSALVRAAEAWARDAGCVWIALDYNARNFDAGRFYRERLGYRPAGEIVVKEL
jgi:GNAT superfamily N-acetyltransferase